MNYFRKYKDNMVYILMIMGHASSSEKGTNIHTYMLMATIAQLTTFSRSNLFRKGTIRGNNGG